MDHDQESGAVPHRLLEPPKSAIMEGYACLAAHQALQGHQKRRPEESDYYILEAVMCMPQAHKDVNEVLRAAGRPEIFHHETGPAEDLIGQAYESTVNKAVSYGVRYRAGGQMKSAHKYLSDLMERLGFRPITDRDFVDIGFGGR